MNPSFLIILRIACRLVLCSRAFPPSPTEPQMTKIHSTAGDGKHIMLASKLAVLHFISLLIELFSRVLSTFV